MLAGANPAMASALGLAQLASALGLVLHYCPWPCALNRPRPPTLVSKVPRTRSPSCLLLSRGGGCARHVDPPPLSPPTHPPVSRPLAIFSLSNTLPAFCSSAPPEPRDQDAAGGRARDDGPVAGPRTQAGRRDGQRAADDQVKRDGPADPDQQHPGALAPGRQDDAQCREGGKL